MTLRDVVISVCLACGAGLCGAQTVYRCGTEGAVSSQQPCPQGRVIDAGDARSPEQQAQTQAAVRRDARVAAALQRERQQRERAVAAPATSLSATPPSAAASASKAPKRTGARAKDASTDFRAVEPAEPGRRKQRKPAAVAAAH